MPQIRILTIDDHPIFREGVAAVISDEPDMRVVGEAVNGAMGIEAFLELRPDVVLMDLKMPDMHGVDAMTSIRRVSPDARIIVLTTYQGDVQTLRAFKAGAYGYLLKGMLRSELVATIRDAFAGKRRIPREIAGDLAVGMTSQDLTEREVGVINLVAQGCSNKEVAIRLGVTEETIKAHMKRILAKLKARDRAHAVAISVRRGFILD